MSADRRKALIDAHGLPPDVTDDALVGVLIGIARRAWGGHFRVSIGPDGWRVATRSAISSSSASEGLIDALVSAVEAAPKRGAS